MEKAEVLEELRALNGVREGDASLAEEVGIMLDHVDAQAMKITGGKRTTRMVVRRGDHARGGDRPELEGLDLGSSLEEPVQLLVLVAGLELGH